MLNEVFATVALIEARDYEALGVEAPEAYGSFDPSPLICSTVTAVGLEQLVGQDQDGVTVESRIDGYPESGSIRWTIKRGHLWNYTGISVLIQPSGKCHAYILPRGI